MNSVRLLTIIKLVNDQLIVFIINNEFDKDWMNWMWLILLGY